jgi:hypothetical protein
MTDNKNDIFAGIRAKPNRKGDGAMTTSLIAKGSPPNRPGTKYNPGSMPISRSKIDPGASVGRRTKSLEPD